MAWFTDGFNRFFKDLAKNNNKEWFDANRKRYEAEVKEPFAAFVAEAIVRIHKLDKAVDIEAKDAIFRIHRDVPPIIFANIGTTMTEAVDDIQRIKGILKKLAVPQYYIHAARTTPCPASTSPWGPRP